MIATTHRSELMMEFIAPNQLAQLVYFISNGLSALSPAIFLLLLFGTAAPYGRYHKSHKLFVLSGDIPGRLGWFLMELPNVLIPIIFFVLYKNLVSLQPTNLSLFSMYYIHYIYRSLIYPFLQANKPQTTITVLSAFVFCTLNAFIQTCSLTILHQYSLDWFHHPTTILGVALWSCGFFTNIYSDHLLRNLRKPGETGYKIPQGFLFNYVSCANYFGEVVEWCGFALATWNYAGLSFAVFTFANLVPRAVQHHRYYKEKFDNYPVERKAVIPFIW